MACTWSKFFIFVAGGAIGSVVTWKLVKDHYAKIANDEISEMREYFAGRLRDMRFDDDIDEPEEAQEEPDREMSVKEYAELLSKNGYTNYTDSKELKKIQEEEYEDVNKPYVISPEEFDTVDGYETVSFTYYADGVLADEYGDVVEDVEEVIGKDSLKTFGQYEDDSVFVRDDEMKVDYEILKVCQNYEDATGKTWPPTNPPRTED